MSLRKYRTRVISKVVDDTTCAIFEAVKEGKLPKVQHIVEKYKHQLCLDGQDENGCTCLGWAAQEGYGDIVEYLLVSGAGVSTADFYGQTALHFAAEFGHVNIAKLLIKAGANVDWMDVNNDGLSCIHIAACKGHTSIARLLIESRCNVNAQDIKGVSVLHCAVANGHQDIVADLLKAGARTNLVGSETSRTPLFLACEMADLEMAELLVDYGAKVNMQDRYAMTPLCLVCIQDNTEIAEFLIRSGAKVNITDRQKNLPIHYTARNNNVSLTRTLLDQGSNIDVINKYFEGPLHLAVRMGHVDIIQLLVEKGCDANICEPYGNITPLHVAVDTFSDDTGTLERILELLILAGCDLNVRAHSSLETAVHRAMKHGCIGTVLTLLQHGADASVPTLYNSTVLQLAYSRGHWSVIETLLYATAGNFRQPLTHELEVRPKLMPYLGRDAAVPWPVIVERIRQFHLHPMSLTRQCRLVIRRAVGRGLHYKLQQIGLPSGVYQFILMKHV